VVQCEYFQRLDDEDVRGLFVRLLNVIVGFRNDLTYVLYVVDTQAPIASIFSNENGRLPNRGRTVCYRTKVWGPTSSDGVTAQLAGEHRRFCLISGIIVSVTLSRGKAREKQEWRNRSTTTKVHPATAKPVQGVLGATRCKSGSLRDRNCK
jgi:hypothetical protein